VTDYRIRCVNEDKPFFSFIAAEQEVYSHSVAHAEQRMPLFLKNPFTFKD